MATIKMILNAIIALPQIFSMINDAIKKYKDAKAKAAEEKRAEAVKDLEKAKTEKEIVDAADKYLDNP